MVEKKGSGESIGSVLKRMLAEAVEAAQAAKDTKQMSQLESRARMIAALGRASVIVTERLGKEDNLDFDPDGDSPEAVERRRELRREIDQRIARIRADLESKSMVGETGEAASEAV